MQIPFLDTPEKNSQDVQFAGDCRVVAGRILDLTAG